jgi:predicted PurR-regulated permease PerM
MKMIKAYAVIVLLTLLGIISTAKADLILQPNQNTSTIEIKNIVRYLPTSLVDFFKNLNQVKHLKYNQLNLPESSFKEIVNKIIDNLTRLIAWIIGIIEIAVKWVVAAVKWILEMVLDFIRGAAGRIEKL